MPSTAVGAVEVLWCAARAPVDVCSGARRRAASAARWVGAVSVDHRRFVLGWFAEVLEPDCKRAGGMPPPFWRAQRSGSAVIDCVNVFSPAKAGVWLVHAPRQHSLAPVWQLLCRSSGAAAACTNNAA